jgi:DNA-binding PadR family transcriptional regulator
VYGSSTQRGEAVLAARADASSARELGMERAGRIKAEWRATENNRRGKYYLLTESGCKALKDETREWGPADGGDRADSRGVRRFTMLLRRFLIGIQTLLSRDRQNAKWRKN